MNQFDVDNLLKYCPTCGQEMTSGPFAWSRQCEKDGGMIVDRIKPEEVQGMRGVSLTIQYVVQL